MNHYIVIRSAYSPNDALALNEHRLSLTERYCVPSLAAQTRKDFILEVRINASDPLLLRRMAAFHSVGVPVLVAQSHEHAIRTRMDDDDAIAVDFVARLQDRTRADGWYSFPNGYATDGTLCSPMRSVSNQFVSRVSDRSIFEINHGHVRNPFIIDGRPGWLWVRHERNRSPLPPSMKFSRPLTELAEMFPCALP